MSYLKVVLKDIVSHGVVLAKAFYSEYRIKKSKSPYLGNRTIYWLGITTLIVNVLAWVFIIWQLPSQEKLIPLHYNIYFGVDVIGYKQRLFNFPIIGFCILIVNFLLGWVIYKKEKVASYILLSIALLVQLILLVASFLILNI